MRRLARTMRIGSLFSGIGGLELGLEAAGVGHAVWQVEQSEFCRDILAKHWPSAERYNDVKQVGKHNLSPVDLICGGFPCQDVSSAGKGAGLAGDRSGLWFEFARIVGELQPTWVVVENVASGAKRWVNAVTAQLGRLGYETLPVPLSAQAVGAPHRRNRVFIVAYSKRNALRQQSRGRSGARGQGAPFTRLNGENGDVTYAFGPRLEKRQGERRDVGEERATTQRMGRGGTATDANRQRQSTLASYGQVEWLCSPSKDGGWEWRPPVPPVHGVDDGLPRPVDRTKRLKALGNAVVPQCAEVIGEIINLLQEEMNK